MIKTLFLLSKTFLTDYTHLDQYRFAIKTQIKLGNPRNVGYDYFEQVFLPAMRCFGVSANVKLIRSGYFPKGGGEVTLSLSPTSLNGNTQWEVEETPHAIIRLSKLPAHIANREANIFREAQFQNIEIIEETALSPGNAVLAWQGYRGAYVLREREKKAEKVAQQAIDELLKENAPIDSHLADQILLYAMLAKGKTVYRTTRLSAHLHTHAYVISHFLNRKLTLNNNTVTVN